MIQVQQSLPLGDTVGADFARELALLLGPAYQPEPGTAIEADVQTLGTALGAEWETQTEVLAEFFPQTTKQLVGEWEARFGLVPKPGASLADRRAALVAHRRAQGGGTAARIAVAVQAIDATATVTPNTVAATHATNPRSVFGFVVTIQDATFDDLHAIASVRETIGKMKPAYTDGQPSTGRPFILGVSKLGRGAL